MSAAMVLLTPEELQELVRDAVREEIGKHRVDGEWLDIAQVAKILGVCTKTVTTYISGKGLPAVRLGQSLRFQRSRVEEWLARQPAPAPPKKKGGR